MVIFTQWLLAAAPDQRWVPPLGAVRAALPQVQLAAQVKRIFRVPLATAPVSENDSDTVWSEEVIMLVYLPEVPDSVSVWSSLTGVQVVPSTDHSILQYFIPAADDLERPEKFTTVPAGTSETGMLNSQ
jgi:hypothetical protein